MRTLGVPLIKVIGPAAKPQLLTYVRTDSPKPGAREDNDSPVPKNNRFRLPASLPSSPSSGNRAGLVPTEYDPVEFDTRMASFNNDELGTNSKYRGRSKDDAMS